MEGKSEYVSPAVAKDLLETQGRSYRTTLHIFGEDMKQELWTIREDVEDFKVSLQFSQGEIQDLKKNSTDTKLYVEQLEDRVKFTETSMKDTYDLERRCDDMENKHEYLENGRPTWR